MLARPENSSAISSSDTCWRGAGRAKRPDLECSQLRSEYGMAADFARYKGRFRYVAGVDESIAEGAVMFETVTMAADAIRRQRC